MRSPPGRRRPVPGGDGASTQFVEELADALAFLQGDHGLLPVGPPAAEPSQPARLAADGHGVDLLDLDIEQFLDGPADLRLGGPAADHEGVLALGHLLHALLGDHRAQDDVVRRGHEASTSSTRRTASRVRTTRPWTSTWRALRC